jgi:hypothetical protein
MKAFRIFIFSIIGVGILFYLTIITAAPLRKTNELNKIATSDSVFMNRFKAIAMYPKLLPLVKERAHKQAQITLAEQDSIGLVLNFKENKASLMLKGVEIHTSQIISYEKDRVFDGIQSPAYRKLFTDPIHNISEYSSVIKEPIVYKKAPKDTIEAMKMLTLPVAPDPEPAYVNFDLEYGIKLILVQNEWITEAEKEVEKKYKSDIRKLLLKNTLGAVLNFKETTYSPTITVVLTNKEVRAIYRALPVKASIVMLL